MNFTQQTLNEAGEGRLTQETFKNKKGENEVREIPFTYLITAREALIRPFQINPDEKKTANTIEMIERRFDLYMKIAKDPKKVTLNEQEIDLLIYMVDLRFDSDVIIVAGLIKFLK